VTNKKTVGDRKVGLIAVLQYWMIHVIRVVAVGVKIKKSSLHCCFM